MTDINTNFRSPICSVVGHVDAGKTLFLDRLRNSAVQQGEPGGITQKIGVTYLNSNTLQDMIGSTKNGAQFAVPGIMFIDTPGHECFTAQRMTGVEISDLVIVVVDIFKGLEQQTIESLTLLRKSKTPCIIIANKVDRIQGWISEDGRNIRESYNNQNERTRDHYDKYVTQLVIHCANEGLNASLYYKNKNHREFISIVPFSAKTGEGMPDLLMMISILCTKYLHKKIALTNMVNTGFLIERMIHKSYGSILTTVLTDGQIRPGDMVLFKNAHGDIVSSKIKRIYVSDEKSEVKDRFNLTSIHEIIEPCSFVLSLEYNGEILTGTRFYVHSNESEKNYYKKELQSINRHSNRSEYSYSKLGVYLVAPTIGMLDALYNICESQQIPISGSKVGFITKTEIIRAKINIEPETVDEAIYYERYSVILAYGFEVSKETLLEADRNYVRIFSNDVIYRLIDEYQNCCESLNNKILAKNQGVHLPFEAHILSQYIFRTDNPILIGVRIESGTLYIGQRIAGRKIDDETDEYSNVFIGTVIGIQNNKNEVESATSPAEVCLKIDNSDTRKKYGKDFDDTCQLVPRYSLDEVYLVRNYPEIFNDD